MGKYYVKLKTIMEELGFRVVYASSAYEDIQVGVSDLNRPGLQLAGFYDYFDPRRIQIVGKVEITYLSTMDSNCRKMRVDALFSRRPIAMVVCHGAEVLPELVDAAQRYNVCLFRAEQDTSECMAKLIISLRRHLAPRTTLHGVLVEVYGEGMLITGDSGIGKSETALELIKRGHRLVADDAVEIRCTSETQLMGTAPEMIRYYMELRGIGVVDVRHLYGIGAVKPFGSIELVANLVRWDQSRPYDRLGLDSEYTEILGVSVPSITIPVAPGRNLAVILELAAMNNRQKKTGHNAAEELVARHDAAVNAGGF